MNRQNRPNYSGIQYFQEMIKVQLCRYFNQFYILNNVYDPKIRNLWIDRIDNEYIYFEANVQNFDTVDFKIRWTTYLAVMANYHLN